MPASFTFEEATQPATFGWEDVVEPAAPETPAEARLKKRERLGLEQEAARIEGEGIKVPEASPTQQPSSYYDYLPTLPPITAAQLAEPPPTPGLFDQFNRAVQPFWEVPTYTTPTEPPVDVFSPNDAAKIEDARSRMVLKQRVGEAIQREDYPFPSGMVESAESGAKALTSPAGLLTTAGAVVAPEVVLPALFAKTAADVPEVVSKVVEHSRFGDDPSSPDYWKAVFDAVQTGAVLTGTLPSFIRLPRAMEAWRESVAQRAERRFEAAKDITPKPPKQITFPRTEEPPPEPGAAPVPTPTPVQPTGGPSASEIESPTTVHGDLRPQPVEGAGPVPVPQGVGGVQPQAAGTATGIRGGEPEAPRPPIPLTPESQPDVQVLDILQSTDDARTKSTAIRKLADERGIPVKDMQETVEANIVKVADSIARDPNLAPLGKFTQLLDLYNRQPTLSARTSTSVELQAYSTPAPLAYALSYASGVTPGTPAYDATAGNGMLLIGSNLSAGHGNELDPKRQANLTNFGVGTVTPHDATDYTPGTTYPFVSLNPPFGSIPNINYHGYGIKRLEHLIALKGLEAMADDGIGSVIMGARREEGPGAHGAQWVFENYLYGHYNVVANFEIAGDLYAKQGAKWPVRVIVVAGRKQQPITGDLAPTTVARLDNWTDVWKEAERIRSEIDRRRSSVVPGGPGGLPEPAAPRPTPTSQVGGLSASPSQTAQPTGGGIQPGGGGGRKPSPGPRSTPGSTQFPPTRPSDEPTNAEITPAQPAGGGQPAPRVEVGVQPTAKPAAPAATGGAGAGGGTHAGSVPKPPAVAGTEFQTPYVSRSEGTPFGTLTPKNIAEGEHSALDKLAARVGPIDQFVADRLNMEPDVLRQVMAAEQIDGVALAIDQIETGGEAVIIGDETGIGKGRQGAAIIRYAILNGKIPLFFTKDPKLFTDMYGDLVDINTQVKPFILGDPAKASIADVQGKVVHRAPGSTVQKREMQSIAEKGLGGAGYNAIFATYSQVNKRNARQEFLEKLAETNPTIVILDESHEAAGDATTSMQAAFMTGGQIVRGSGANQTTTNVPGLLRQPGTMPGQGGVLYMSATYAKRPENMPVYFRTALSRSADSFGQVVDAMKRGGVALQQAVSEALAKSGQYLRRERDFTGVSFDVKQVQPDNPQKLIEDIDQVTDVLGEIVRFSQMMRGTFEGATAQSETAISMTEFASVVHNQISQLLLAAKADHVVAEAIAAVKKGEKPLIALMNTMESFLDQYVMDHGIKPGQRIQLRWNELLKYALERSLRVSEELPNGDTRVYSINPDEYGLGDYYRQIQSMADSVESGFPISPIDYIIQKLAKAGIKMSELTGRKSGIEYTNFETGEGIYRKFQTANKNRVVNGFNNGDVEGMLLNASGSTGLSAHASVKFRDKKPRHMIIAQPAADINVFMQTLGRIKRTGMVSQGTNPDGTKYGAKYTYMVLPLQAELRPAAMASRKMKSLNANTTAEAAGAVKIQAEDIYNRYGDLIVSEYLGANPEVQRLLGIGIDYNQDGSINVERDIARKFTGRQALLPDADQAAAYAEILPAYRSLIEQLKSTGDYDLEIVVHDDWAGVRESDEELAAGTDPSNIFTAGLRVQQWEIADNRHVPTGEEMRTEFSKRIGTRQKALDDWRVFEAKADNSFATREARIAEQLATASEADRPKLEMQRTSLADMRRRWDQTKARIADVIEGAGQTVELSNTETGDFYEGLMTDVTFPKGTNVAPSAFRFRFMVNDPAGTIHLTGGDLTHGKWALTESDKRLIDFTGERAGQRTTRYFVTGNPIQGFNATGGHGKMVRFKSADGDIVTGILMPRNWTTERLANDPRLDLVSGRAVARFLGANREHFLVESKGLARIRWSHRGFVVSVPAARSTGSGVYLDQPLRAITGDFVKTGSRMVVVIPESQLQATAERIQAILSAKFRAIRAPGYIGDMPSVVRKVSESNAAAASEQRGPLPFFSRRSEAQGLGEPSTAPNIEDVRRQRLLDREGTPVPPNPNEPTPPPAGPPAAELETPEEPDIVDAIRRQDVMPGRDWIASPEFEFRKNPIGAMLVTRIVEAELEYQGQVSRDRQRFDDLRRGLSRPQQVRITKALRDAQQGDTTALEALPDRERAVASQIRQYFEDVRRAIIDSKRDDLIESLPEARAAAVHDILSGMDEADAFRAHRLRAAGQAAVRDALRELEALEDWGIEDYITNIERGSYRVVTPDGTTVAVAETRVAAKEKALKYARENPGVTRLTISDEFASGAEFPTKLTRGQYFRMALRAARALGTDVREIQRMLRAEGSPIVVVAPTSKFAGPLQRRYGVLKGEENIFDALPAYSYSVRKKLALDPVFKQARTDATLLPPEMQKQVRDLMDDVRGRYHLADKIADYALSFLGGKPFAYSRGVGVARNVVAWLKLGFRPVTAIINRLGGLQHTWTKVGTGYWLAGRRFLKTPEFARLWHENADYVGATAQAFLEAGHREVPWYHPLAMFQYAERVNRPEAFAAFFKYAEGELGLTGEEAAAFARKATRFAQFTYTVSSLPRILRNPTGRLVGQFKAYLVKEMEFVSSLRGFEIPRYITAFLAMGGPRAFIYFLRSLPFLGAIGALWALEDWLNRKAPKASRGLPGYAGVDVTAAVTPQLPAKGTDWIGPALSDAWKLWDEVIRPALQGESRDLSDLKDWGTKLAPATLYWSRLIEAVASREGWITDERGRPQYKPGPGGKVALAFGAKPLEQAVQEVDRAYMDHVNDIAKKNREHLVNRILKTLDRGDGVTLDKLLKDAADYGIDTKAITEAAKQRVREPDERLRRRLLKSVRVEQAEREQP